METNHPTYVDRKANLHCDQYIRKELHLLRKVLRQKKILNATSKY